MISLSPHHFSLFKTLKTSISSSFSSSLLPKMKDRPSSYGSVYVPPHQRLLSVITVPSSNTSSTSSTATTVSSSDSAIELMAQRDHKSPPRYDYGNPNPNAMSNSSFPYLLQQQQHQLQKNLQYGYVYDDHSEDGEFEPSLNPNALTPDNIEE